jgi:hypothetical protein
MQIHPKVYMIKGAKYRVAAKVLEAHIARVMNICSDTDIVTNLLEGNRVWTMIEFGCGERIKINCQLLSKL